MNNKIEKSEKIMKQIYEDFWQMANSHTLKSKIDKLKKLQCNIKKYLDLWKNMF